VDVILTGDKNFLSLDLNSPKPMTIAQLLESEFVDKRYSWKNMSRIL